jgi:hypothetical protein
VVSSYFSSGIATNSLTKIIINSNEFEYYFKNNSPLIVLTGGSPMETGRNPGNKIEVLSMYFD